MKTLAQFNYGLKRKLFGMRTISLAPPLFHSQYELIDITKMISVLNSEIITGKHFKDVKSKEEVRDLRESHE
jgi:hypothetical protein